MRRLGFEMEDLKIIKIIKEHNDSACTYHSFTGFYEKRSKGDIMKQQGLRQQG